MIEHLCCCADANLSEKFMTTKSLQETNTKMRSLYRQHEFLHPKLSRLLYKSLIQLHFDYPCIS